MCTLLKKKQTNKYRRRKYMWKIFHRIPTSPFTKYIWKLDEPLTGIDTGFGNVKGLVGAFHFHGFAHKKDALRMMKFSENGMCRVVCRVEILEYAGAGVHKYVSNFCDGRDAIVAKKVMLHKKDWEKRIKE